MKKINSAFAIILLALVVMSCSLVQRFMPGGNEALNRTSDLWPDVPKMDGLSPSDLEMPFMVKLFMRTMLNNLYRLNKEGEDKTPVEGDWIVFSSSKPPSDVQGFYTSERMTSFGKWQASKNSTCFDGKDKGYQGVVCVFEKLADGKQIELLILAGQDDEKKQTNIFYLRLEGPIDKNRKTSASTTAPASPKTRAITKLTGKAPYGIESRAEPTGTDLDQLLPKQVGPYSRVKLEKSEQRGTTPTSVDVDGSSIYATYREGSKEVFVELGLSTDAEDAQEALKVAAGDAASGDIPSDPDYGSIGTEPSYLKVVNADGAFFAWTRGGYFFSADAKSGESDLAAFMNRFSY
jgi:hypothetical protein